MSKLFCYRPLKVGVIKHTPTDRYQTVSLRPPIKRSKVGGWKVGGAKENANLGNSMSALETYPDVKIL